MIQGFHLRFTSDELRAHLVARAEHHDGRATTKEAEIPALREVAEKIRPAAVPTTAGAMSKLSNAKGGIDVGDAIDGVEDQIRDHRNKAIVFRLFSEHLYSEDYDLTETDLVRLEILRR